MITKIDRLFGSETRVALLKNLLANPNRSFYLRELSRSLNLTFSSIHKEVENLKALGLVIEEAKGRLRLFKINKKSPIYEELKRIFLKTESLGDLLRKNLEKTEIIYALIYGSFAKGEEIETSDIDLLVVGWVKEEKLFSIIQKIEKQIGREVEYILWSEKEFKKKIKEKHHLLMEIVKNPIIGIFGDMNEFRKVVKG